VLFRSEDDPYFRVDLAAGLEQRKLRNTINFDVLKGRGHRVHMARLACEVKDQVLSADEISQGVGIANVTNVDSDAVSNLSDVEEVAAGILVQAIDENNLGSCVDKASRQSRADQTDSTGYKNLRPKQLCRISHGSQPAIS
jgi:hypothetical protein